MKVALVSIFRDSLHGLKTYLAQVKALDNTLRQRGDELFCAWAEGDSEDSTWEKLQQWSIDLDCSAVKHNTNTPRFGPVINPIRLKAKAETDRAALALIPNDGSVDAVIFVESDLWWEPTCMLALLDDLKEVEVVAPWCWCNGRMRDIWGFRRQGTNFVNDWPFHPSLDWSTPLVEMDSVGSCWVARYPVIAGLEVPDEDEWVGFCRKIREERSAKIYLDTRYGVRHPWNG